MEAQDQRNLIIAVVLMVIFLFGYQVFWQGPQEAKRRQAAEAARIEQAAKAPPTPAPTSTSIAPAIQPRDQILNPQVASNARVAIEGPAVDGSILLKGAQIDDLSLKGFYETVKDKETQNKKGEVKLLSPNGSDRAFYALMFWSTGASTTETDDWAQVSTGALTPQNPLKLQLVKGVAKIDRTITLDDHYMFAISDTVTNTGPTPITVHPEIYVRQRALEEHIKTPPTEQQAHRGMLGMFADNQINQTVNYGDLQKGKTTDVQALKGWISLTTKYWMAAAIPHQGDPVRMKAGATTLNNEQTFFAGFVGSDLAIQPGQSVSVTNHLFAGAKVVDVLDAYQQMKEPNGTTLSFPWLTDAVDWSWLSFITKPFFWLLNYFHKFYAGINWSYASFGLAIMTLTVCVKLVFFPIQWNMYQSMSKMRKIQPEMEDIRKRFASDKQRQQQEMLKLYQREKANPLAGCLPMLPQVFVFWALYHTLMVTIEMRQAPFFGWVKDMSAPDPTNLFNLFGLLPFDPTHLPFIGGFLHVGVWPLLYGGTMYLLQGLSAPPTDPTQKMIMRLMPAVFLFLFASVAAGLAIYWVWSNLITMCQQYFIMRQNGVDTELDKFIKKRFGKKEAA
jgi:YidC/Oxa1 family membrane protein insertase